ncbi:hypothetical protein ACOMHN_009275 [Nucella lapillus]
MNRNKSKPQRTPVSTHLQSQTPLHKKRNHIIQMCSRQMPVMIRTSLWTRSLVVMQSHQRTVITMKLEEPHHQRYQDCTNRCCNSTTCRLHPQAACGAGHCCDFTSCQVSVRFMPGQCPLQVSVHFMPGQCPLQVSVHLMPGQCPLHARSVSTSGQCPPHARSVSTSCQVSVHFMPGQCPPHAWSVSTSCQVSVHLMPGQCPLHARSVSTSCQVSVHLMPGQCPLHARSVSTSGQCPPHARSVSTSCQVSVHFMPGQCPPHAWSVSTSCQVSVHLMPGQCPLHARSVSTSCQVSVHFMPGQCPSHARSVSTSCQVSVHFRSVSTSCQVSVHFMPGQCPLQVSVHFRSVSTSCQVSVHFMPGQCPLHARSVSTSGQCPPHARSVSTSCQVSVHLMPGQCPLHARSVSTSYQISVHFMPGQCPLQVSVHFMPGQCPPHARSVSTSCQVSVHFMPGQCPLHARSVSTSGQCPPHARSVSTSCQVSVHFRSVSTSCQVSVHLMPGQCPLHARSVSTSCQVSVHFMPGQCPLHARSMSTSGQCPPHARSVSTSCQVKEASTRCRDAANECDLPEFCDGTSQFCPGDFYLQDGKPCASGQSYCYRGQCRTHTGQCQLLWGETGRVSDPLCFQHLNVWGTRDGNCGYNWTTERYHTCERENVMCGLLHCVHLNEKLMFWRDNLALTMRANFLSRGNQQYTCRSTMLDVGLDVPDPGMVPDGAKCEDKKICIKQTCTPLLKLKIPKCQDCHGNGVCNNAGHCHCEVGYKPPLCDRPGYGGSINSGPATNQYANRKLLIGLLVLFLVIIPLLVLVVIAYLNRRRLAVWLKREPRGRFSALRRTNHPPAPPRPQPSNGVSQKRWSSAPNRANPRLDISGPLLEPPPAVDGTTTPDRASSNPPQRPEAPPRPIYKPSASRPAGLSLAGGHSGPPPAYPDATAARGDVRNVTASGVAGSGVKASSSSSSRPASQATPKPKPTSATRSQGMPAPNTANPKASSQQSEGGPKKVANTASPKALLQSERGPKQVANTASPKALQSERGPKKVATGRPSLSPPTSPSRASKQIGHSQPVREPKNGNTGENPSSPPRVSKPIGLSQSVCEPRSGDHSGENLLPKRQSFRGADISSPVLVSTTNRDSKVFADFEVDQSGVIARPVQTHHSFHSASPASSRDGMRSPVRRTMSDRPFSPPTRPGVGEEEGEETGMAFTPRPLPPEPVYEDEPVYMNEELSDLGDLEAHISSAFDGLYRNVPDQDTDTTTTTTPTTPSTMPHPPTQPPTPAGNRSDNLSKPAESKHSTGPPRPAILPKVSSSGMSQNPANKPAGREENQGAKNPIRTGSGSQPPLTSKSSSVVSKAQSLENKLAGGSGPKHTPPQSAGRGGGSVRPATVNTQGSGPNRGQPGIAQSAGTGRGPPGGSASKGQKPSAQSQLPEDRGSKPAGAAGKNSAAVSDSSDAPGMGSLAVKRLGEGGAGRGVGEGVSSGRPNPGRPSLAPKPAASGKPVRSYKF